MDYTCAVELELELELALLLLLCLVYFVSGFLDGISGGGGLLAVPALLLAGVPPEFVLGTNKLAMLPGTAVSLATFARGGFVTWQLVRVGVPIAVVGTLFGAAAILRFDNAGIGRAIVFLLPLGIAATLLPKKDRGGSEQLARKSLYVAAPLVCAVLGVYDGFFGPGSASFLILAFHCILGLGLLHAAATTKVFNLASVIVALCVFAWHGKILYLLAVPLGATYIGGIYIGSKMAIRSGAAFVRKVLIVSLTLLFASLVWKFYLV